MGKHNYKRETEARKSTNFEQSRLQHSYDGHRDIYGLLENKNKQNLENFKKNVYNDINLPEFELINGSYRYQTPAYLYYNKAQNVLHVVNATDDVNITSLKPTPFQQDQLRNNNNIGLDTQPVLRLTLRLRGPSNCPNPNFNNGE